MGDVDLSQQSGGAVFGPDIALVVSAPSNYLVTSVTFKKGRRPVLIQFVPGPNTYSYPNGSNISKASSAGAELYFTLYKDGTPIARCIHCQATGVSTMLMGPGSTAFVDYSTSPGEHLYEVKMSTGGGGTVWVDGVRLMVREI